MRIGVVRWQNQRFALECTSHLGFGLGAEMPGRTIDGVEALLDDLVSLTFTAKSRMRAAVAESWWLVSRVFLSLPRFLTDA